MALLSCYNLTVLCEVFEYFWDESPSVLNKVKIEFLRPMRTPLTKVVEVGHFLARFSDYLASTGDVSDDNVEVKRKIWGKKAFILRDNL